MRLQINCWASSKHLRVGSAIFFEMRSLVLKSMLICGNKFAYHQISLIKEYMTYTDGRYTYFLNSFLSTKLILCETAERSCVNFLECRTHALFDYFSQVVGWHRLNTKVKPYFEFIKNVKEKKQARYFMILNFCFQYFDPNAYYILSTGRTIIRIYQVGFHGSISILHTFPCLPHIAF